MIMVEAGFSSPRMDAFPAGLRVLVVDDDPTWLKILEKMLKKCHYEVTTCGLAREALKALREHKDGFDIVISDVNMPDMDGFKLLEHVGLEMDLPVIMMSVDGETSRVMKGVQHGACDYLLKPIRMKELRNIWQHVFRKKMREVKDIEGHDYYEDIQMFRNGSESSDDSPFITGGDHTSIRKRKDTDNKYDEKDYNDPSSTKKPRVVWSVDLHQKFVKAVNQIGFDKVGPKKILELMKVPRLTRENVASHLQKYRLYLSRLQKENEQKTSNGPLNSDSPPKDFGASFCFQESSCGGSKNSDHPPRDPDAGRFGLQISMNMQQRDAAGSSQLFPANKLPMTTSDTRSSDIDLKSFNMLPLTEPTEPIKSDISGSCEASPVGLDHSFGQVEPITKYAAFESPGSDLYPWSGELPESRYKHEYKPQQLDDIFNHPTIEAVEHPPIESDLLQPAACISSRLSSKQEDQVSPAEMKPLNAEINCNDIGQPVPIGTAVRESTFDSKSHLLNLQQQFDPAPSGSAFDVKNHSTSHNDTLDLEYGQLNQIQGTESAFGSLADELKAYWLQDYNFSAGPSFDSTGVHYYNLPQLISDVPTHLHSMPRFDESFYDLMEYPVVDQSLSIT